MKKSNIILICAVLPFLIWLLLCGWLQANAYNSIISGKICGYAIIDGQENVKQLPSIKNIKVVVDKVSLSPMLQIQYGTRSVLSYVKSIKNAISYSITGDTLNLRIKNVPFKRYDHITINVPSLNSINISSATKSMAYEDNIYAIISGFNGKNLSIKNEGSSTVIIKNNKFNKLKFKSNFYEFGRIEILNYSDCDSLDVDVEGQYGTYIIGDPKNAIIKKNPKQWVNIKVPATFRVEADAAVVSEIIIKK